MDGRAYGRAITGGIIKLVVLSVIVGGLIVGGLVLLFR
jgi:hypothetical protein